MTSINILPFWVLLTISFHFSSEHNNLKQIEIYRAQAKYNIEKSEEYISQAKVYSMQAEAYIRDATQYSQLGNTDKARTCYDWAKKAMVKSEANLLLYDKSRRKASHNIDACNRLIRKGI